MKLSVVALASITISGTISCGHHASEPSPIADHVHEQAKDTPTGLDLQVSNGKQSAAPYDHAKLAAATKLANGEAQALFARAQPLAVDPADQTAFALRAGSQPAPRTGQTIKDSFPPPPSSLLPPAQSDAGKLQVVRWTPEGEVPVAPQLSVTFSQPMVAVTSQDDAAAITPVKLTPTPKGKWRWIGTRTIVFDPEIRFPQATTYHVEVPAGTKSATGGVLATPASFTFETPAPTIVKHVPAESEPQKLDVPIFVMFDQKIDPRAVLAAIKVTAKVGWDAKPQAIRLIEPAEIAKDKQLQATVAAADKDEQAGRWLAFRTVTALPADATIEVSIDKGTPSAEGSNKTKAVQTFELHTYPPLRVVRAECGYNDDCHPGMAYTIHFDNPLDADRFEDQQVKVSPEIPGMKLQQRGAELWIEGMTKARTTYTVTLGGGITDEFGQRLGRDETRTFRVGDAVPTFYGPDGMVVLDPAAKLPALDFFSTNYDLLSVKLYKVTPQDLGAFGAYTRERWNHDHPPSPPGVRVLDKLVRTSVSKNELVETAVDLSPALSKAGLGDVLAVVQPSPWTEKGPPPQMIVWVQATKLAIDAHVDNDNLIAFASELATGKPAANVELELQPFGLKATTDDKGLATIPLATALPKGLHYLVARRGDDVAFVTENEGYWGGEYGNWFKHALHAQLAWYVIDDRKMYRPGEEVSLKGWLRAIDNAKNGDVGGILGNVDRVDYTAFDARNVKIGSGSVPVNALGGFDVKLALPKTPNLGYARIAFAAQGKLLGSYDHGFQIEEFRRPEFEASAHASQGPFVIGGAGDITVDAKYFAGGPLGGAPVNWYVSASQTTFTPPNRDDFVFGNWQPWWGYHDWANDDRGETFQPQKTWNLASTTDASGSHVLHLDFLSVKPAMPMSVTASANVSDVNRQSVSASAAVIVHPSTLYVGLKTKKPFVEKGTPFDVDVIGVDLDGKAVPGAKIEVKAARLDWEYKKGRYQSKEVDPQTCPVVAAQDPSPCHFTTKTGGTYQLTATIVDDKGRPNQTKLEFWVSGGEGPPARDVERERVQLIPDKKDYVAGNTAEILVQAPFTPAEGVVTWRRSGIVKTERITMTSSSTVITVPISDAMVPNMIVQVDLVGMATRTDDKGEPDPKLPKRPAYAVGAIDLPVPPTQRTLAVSVAPSVPKLGPGESAKLQIEVKDATGRPVGDAETAVIVVDEAILSLTGYQFENPIGTFYPRRGDVTRDAYLRAYVKLARPELGRFDGNAAPAASPTTTALPPPPGDVDADGIVDASDQESTTRMGWGNKNAQGYAPARMRSLDPAKPNAPGPQQPAIAIRTDFNPLAAFSPAVKTDAQGRATVDIKVPDNLTRYRIVAIAVAGDKQFGKGESSLIARLPLMVRPSPPRFLNFGDTFRLPVVVQNQTDAAMTVKLAVRATNAAITDGAGREVTVPANDRVEVQFPAAAALAGTARFQVIATNGRDSDAADLALPVWTPATTEAFATYGVIDDGVVKQPVALPGKVITQFGGLEVTTASTNLQALTDAMLYLVHYPFECAEQRSSRILAIATLRDVLTAFKTKDMPSAAAMEHSVEADIEHLSQMQNADGGFAFWDRGFPSEPYLTVFVANALAHAKAKGFAVPQRVLDQARDYLRVIESHFPATYPVDVRWAIRAFALYTRKQLGDLDIAKGKKLLAEAGGVVKVSMETDGWLLGLFAQNKDAVDERKAIVRHALDRVSETAGAANFTTSYGDGNYLLLSSDRRVDGVMLESLIEEQRDLDLIPKVVTGLLAHRKAGRWLDTQENAFVLQALDLYFQTYEKVTPDFVARVWLGNDYAGEHAFKGHTTEDHQIAIAMTDVATHDKADLTIQKAGQGRLYYRIGMTYAPASLRLEPADHGFVVERRYEAVDDPGDVTRAKDGTWHIKAGSRVRVKLTMVNENRRYHVALVDPMPAGLEGMNPALAVTGPIPTDPSAQNQRRGWWGPWFEHQNMRDERVEAFTPLLWEGVHPYDYVARATTPGNFVVPPPKAEEMYMPETFGRGASDRVIIE